jgi:hypothetical protein
MKKLLTITAISEAATGLGLLATPAVLARLLLGGTRANLRPQRESDSAIRVKQNAQARSHSTALPLSRALTQMIPETTLFS